MTSPSRSRVTRQLSAASAGSAIGVFGIGCLVLVGWIFDIAVLKSLNPDWISMKANTAVAFMLAGIALWLSQAKRRHVRPARYVAWGSALVVAAMGLLTLIQYASGWSLGIDQLLFTDPPGAAQTVYPGRLAPNTALNFLLIGLALVLLDVETRRGHRPAQYLIVLEGIVALMALVGYLYGVSSFYSPSPAANPMSLPAVVAGVVAFIGLGLARPGPGLLTFLAGESAGSIMARRFVLPAVLVPILLDLLLLAGEHAGLYGEHLASAVHAVLQTAFFLGLVWVIAASLNRVDSERREAEQALRKAHDELETRVQERTAELEKASQSLADERQRFQDVLDMLPAYLVLLSPDYRVPFANRFFEERFGRSGGKRCFEYLFQRTEPCENCETYKVLKTGGPHRWEWTGPDGRNYDIYDFPFTDVDGSPLIMEVGLDITERKRAEEALRRSSAYNRSLIEANLDPLVTIGPEGNITDVNAATEAATGRPRAELIGMDFCDYFTEPEKARAGYEQVFREGSVRDYALELRHRDGHVTSVLYNASVYRDEAGRVIGAFAAARDITERKRAEQQASLLAAIVESSDDAILSKTMEGIIVSWNKGAHRLYGYTADEVVGKPVSIVLPPGRPDETPQLVRRVSRGESVEHYETVRRRKDGKLITVSLTLSPVRDGSGEVVGVSTIARDDSDRKQAEEAVRLANAYNRSLIEASLDPLVTIGPDGKITDVNTATEAATGRSRAELIGTDFCDYFTEPEQARAGYEQVFREGSVRDYALELRHRDGHVTCVLYNASVYRDEGGKVVGVFAAARDITERRRAEAELEKHRHHLEDLVHERTGQLEAAHAQLQTIIENVTEGLVVASLDGQLTHWNRAALEMHGLASLEEARRLSESADTFEFAGLDGEVWPVDQWPLARILRGEHLRNLEVRIRRVKSDWERVFSYGGTLVRDAERRPLLAVVTLSDVTERKRAEEALRRLAQFPEENPNPVLRIAEDGRLMYANAAARACLAAMGHAGDGRLPAGVQAVAADAFRQGQPVEAELEDRHGRTYWFGAVHPPGERYVNLYARDVTERKRAEEARRRTAEELARSNKELEQFAYVASHDLQEPLRVVTGYLQLIERRYKNVIDADANDFIHFAVDGAARMQQLISDLLDYCRVGTQGKPFAPTNLEAVLDRALGNLQVAIGDTGAVVTRDPLPTVEADQLQWIRLFQNLIGNAIKYRGERRPEIHVSARQKTGHWVFSIRDNGIGIEPQYWEKIFAIFQRLHPRQKYSGTGIGLSICKRIVERHGGRIWLESRPGQGTTFYWTI